MDLCYFTAFAKKTSWTTHGRFDCAGPYCEVCAQGYVMNTLTRTCDKHTGSMGGTGGGTTVRRLATGEPGSVSPW